jgi:hypothetical protein
MGPESAVHNGSRREMESPSGTAQLRAMMEEAMGPTAMKVRLTITNQGNQHAQNVEISTSETEDSRELHSRPNRATEHGIQDDKVEGTFSCTLQTLIKTPIVLESPLFALSFKLLSTKMAALWPISKSQVLAALFIPASPIQKKPFPPLQFTTKRLPGVLNE